jgi:hypothetical protein
MTELRTREEALSAIDRGLAQWTAASLGVLTQAAAHVETLRGEGERKIQRLQAKVAATEALLRSRRPENDSRPNAPDLAEAVNALRVAQQAVTRIALVSQQLGALLRGQTRSNEAAVSGARSDLTRRVGELATYRAAGGTRVAAGATAQPGAFGDSWLGGTGLSEVNITDADFSDNPVIGKFGRGDTTLADYRWAVQTWQDVVGPGVGQGMTREDFEARDTQRGAPALRRTTAVYDMFLGDADRLRLTRRPDGVLHVDNGRHRIQVARELGITHLPAQVHQA